MAVVIVMKRKPMSNADRLFWWCEYCKVENIPVQFNGMYRGKPMTFDADITDVHIGIGGRVAVIYSVKEKQDEASL